MNKYYYIQAAGTFTIDVTAGELVRIVINTTAAGTITVYDDDSAVATSVMAVLKSNVAEGSYTYEVGYTRGLTIVTAAASDITVVTR